MDCAHILRARQVPQFGDLARIEAFRLKLRTHRPVEEQRGVAEHFAQFRFARTVKTIALLLHVVCRVLYHNYTADNGGCGVREARIDL